MKPLSYVENNPNFMAIFRGNILTKKMIKQKINSFTVLLLQEKARGGKNKKQKGKKNTILTVSLKNINYKDILYGEDTRLRVQSGWHCMT